jgi:hypothetical protein
MGVAADVQQLLEQGRPQQARALLAELELVAFVLLVVGSVA